MRFIKAIPDILESALRALPGGDFLADYVFDKKTEDELAAEDIEKEQEQKKDDRNKRIQADAAKLLQESRGKMGYKEAMEQAEKMENQRAATPARQKRIEALLQSEGEAGLDRSIAHMRSQMEKEGTNKELLASLLKDYEAKHVEEGRSQGVKGSMDKAQVTAAWDSSR